ncbi:MAG: hypothetical protein ACFBSG_05590 [Leptolyngbyaceae cyanobacterium]
MTENQTISQLTLAQEGQLTDYQQKWQNLTFPGNLSSELAIQSAINKAYWCLDLPIPEVYVFESLFDITDTFWSSASWQNSGDAISLQKKLLQPLIGITTKQVTGKLWGKLWNILQPLEHYAPLTPDALGSSYGSLGILRMQIDDFFTDSVGFRHCSRIDFCHRVLGCNLDTNAWRVLYDLIQQGGWLFPYEHLCVAVQKRIISSVRPENKALVDSLTQPSAQVLGHLRLAALESLRSRPKLAYERWLNTIFIAQDRLSGRARDRAFLAIIQQAKPITTYIDKDEYPFRDASSPFASDVWARCRQIVQLIETPELQTQAQSLLPEI